MGCAGGWALHLRRAGLQTVIVQALPIGISPSHAPALAGELERAVPRRRDDFRCALGCPSHSVGPGLDRRPMKPESLAPRSTPWHKYVRSQEKDPSWG